MRFLFQGLKRETWESVEGRVNAPNADAAYNVLGDHGIVCESLEPELITWNGNGSALKVDQKQLAEALERALDDAGMRIRFDELTRRYHGKSVWVLDRKRIARVLAQMFQEPRNGSADRFVNSPALEGEVARLTTAVGQIERAMASAPTTVAPAERSREGRTVRKRPNRREKRDEVLLEIFEDNVDLMRGSQATAPLDAGATLACT